MKMEKTVYVVWNEHTGIGGHGQFEIVGIYADKDMANEKYTEEFRDSSYTTRIGSYIYIY